MSVEGKRFHEDFRLRRLPARCELTWLGDPKGADEQYRCPDGLHVRRYANQLEGHYDKVDPREDLFGHIVHDAPGWGLLGVAVGGVVGALVLGSLFPKPNKDQIKDKRISPRRRISGNG